MNLKDKTLWQRNAAAIGGMVLFAAGIWMTLQTSQ